MGKWYELERYPFLFETFQKCVFFDYSLNPNGTIIGVYEAYTTM